jgi:hypothetical protein
VKLRRPFSRRLSCFEAVYTVPILATNWPSPMIRAEHPDVAISPLRRTATRGNSIQRDLVFNRPAVQEVLNPSTLCAATTCNTRGSQARNQKLHHCALSAVSGGNGSNIENSAKPVTPVVVSERCGRRKPISFRSFPKSWSVRYPPRSPNGFRSLRFSGQKRSGVVSPSSRTTPPITSGKAANTILHKSETALAIARLARGQNLAAQYSKPPAKA